MVVGQTLRVLYKALLTQHRELARIKDAQITSVERTLRAYHEMELMSPDPADPSVTTRVLAVMLVEEY
jgi:hypothetical protein